RHRRLVADARVLLVDLHARPRVGAAVVVEDQRVAPDVALGLVRALEHLHQAAVARAAAVLGDRLRVDDRRRLRRGVGHLRPLAPASWCWPSPAYATESTSPCAFGPVITTAGYFIVSFDPRLPSIHSTVASVSARARLVTRL